MASLKAKTCSASSTQAPVHKKIVPEPLDPSKNTNFTPRCPYHDPLLRLPLPDNQPRDATVMERFLLEGPAVQSAVFNRPDNGLLSISKGCTCLDKVEKGVARL
ncbi:hypothetical protein PV04_09131 [Phialophora macrospora]|uniref:Uncharacterized protein n=1 Tax=Phialophora macrospora TaxID=1851006 RepID=A0A0D2F840_9EURO|nr:hypothetical protein PV04_09131 [Phialophora macrospora]